ncbi:MAG: DHA2 family efflux MFS transporter permease subunit [Chloroflexi bacterium]|nr:MAG: DHA2 family efflux MFS transporter permease subunit [Chloroflexota bacterium]
MRTAINTIYLGPRARRIVRFAARFVNPIVLLIAGRRWMPVVGILRHRGRRSGREYATPIGMRPLGDGFVIPRTFSDNAAWYQNVKAAGEGRITYLGRHYRVVEPEVVDYATAKPAFPRYELAQFRLIGINEYMRMRVLPDDVNQTQEQNVVDTKSAIQLKSPPRNLNLALVVIALAQLMVVLDVAIVNVALPSIQRELHFAATDLEWVVNAYAIAFGGLLLFGGRTGDLFGRRRMFIIGALMFTAGSMAGGLATSSTFLIAARAAQGVGAAILAPTALSLLAATFRQGAQRNRALGVYSAVSAGGGGIGLLMGGVITNYLSWRWIMFVNVPIGLLLAFAAPRVLIRGEGKPGRLDLPGALTVTAGVSLLVYGLARVATHDWSDNVTRAVLAIAVTLLVTFVALESRGRHPLMPLRIFANRNRSGAYGLSLAIGAALSGMLFLLTLFMQNVLGFSPLQAGFAFLPTALGVVVGAGLTSRVIGRVGPRVPMTTGALLAATGMFWLSAVTVHANYFADVLGPLVVLAIGLGMAFVSTSVTAISGVQPNESGLASALLSVGRQLGGSLGIAIMGNIATTVTRNQLATGPFTHAAVNRALTTGFSAAFEIAGLIALAGFVTALVAVRHRQSPAIAGPSVEVEVAA